MGEKLEKYEYGALNPLYPSGYEDALDMNNHEFGLKHLTNTIAKSYEPNAIIGSGPYKGIVLREDLVDEQYSGYNSYGHLRNHENVKKLRSYRIMVPELHALYPQPQKYFKDTNDEPNDPEHRIIDLYPSFISESLDTPEPPPGALVWVNFGNTNTGEDPIYLYPVDGGPPPGPTGAGTPSGPWAAGAGGIPPGGFKVPMNSSPLDNSSWNKYTEDSKIEAPKTWGDMRKWTDGSNGFPARTAVKPGGKKSLGIPAGLRKWKYITGICLHCTACLYGGRAMNAAIQHAFSRPAPRSNPGGTVGDDKSLSIEALQRWNTLNVHAIVPKYFNRCRPVLLHDPLLFIWHAKQLSPTTIGIEIEGTPGGDCNLPWKPATNYSPRYAGCEALEHSGKKTQFVNDLQIEWARTLVSYYIENVPAWAKADGVDNHEIRYIQAHRQSEPGKPNDPGQQIWREVAVWAANKYKLGYGPSENLANGQSTAFWYIQNGNGLSDIWTGERNGIKQTGNNNITSDSYDSRGELKAGQGAYNTRLNDAEKAACPCRWEKYHNECYTSEYPLKKYSSNFNEKPKVYTPGTDTSNKNSIQAGNSVGSYSSGLIVSKKNPNPAGNA
jgi:hypothetical protein